MHLFILLVPCGNAGEIIDSNGQTYPLSQPVLVNANSEFSTRIVHDCAAVYFGPDTMGRPLYNIIQSDRSFTFFTPATSARLTDSVLRYRMGYDNHVGLLELSKWLIDEMSNRTGQCRKIDTRTVEVCRLMGSDPTQSLCLTNLAKQIGISNSRLRHLFREDTDITLREYSIWLRCMVSVELVARGVALPQIAKSAGFSDQSHLSRMYRRVMGVRVSRSKLTYRAPYHYARSLLTTVGIDTSGSSDPYLASLAS